MRILNEDRTNSVTGGSALSGFPASNVENDRPRKPWISSSVSGETFTISLNASASYPVEAMFLHGFLADSCTWVLKNAAGSTIDSGTLDCTFPAGSDLSGNPNNMNTGFVDQAHFLRSFFVVFDSSVTDNGSVVLTLATSQNMGGKNIEGNAVSSWVRDGSSTGRLLDSSGAAINIQNHGRIFVGSHISANVISNPVTTNTTVSSDSFAESPLVINGGVSLTINGSVSLTTTASQATSVQVTSITGDGTASGAVSVSSDFPTSPVAYVYNPIKIGIARAGKTLNLPSPSRQMSFQYKDYSVRRRQPTGGYSYQQRPIAREISGSSILSTSQAQNFQDFYRGYRSKPVPVLFVQDMPTAFEEEEKGNLFGYFQGPPQFNFLNKDYQSVQFSICEVI